MGEGTKYSVQLLIEKEFDRDLGFLAKEKCYGNLSFIA